MRSIRILILVLIAAAPAYATAVRIDSESEFLAAIQTPYLFEDFGEYTYGSYIAPTLFIAQYNYEALLSAETKLYSGLGNMSTRCVNDILVMDFTDSPAPVTAVGGYFWPTGYWGNNLTGYTRVVLSDASVYEIEVSEYGSFLGLVSLDQTAFERLEISVLGKLDTPWSWPTVDNLYAGTALELVGMTFVPVPSPEPSSLMLSSAGLCGFGAIALGKCRRRRRDRS